MRATDILFGRGLDSTAKQQGWQRRCGAQVQMMQMQMQVRLEGSLYVGGELCLREAQCCAVTRINATEDILVRHP
jgi:hypothetical protein